MTQETTQTGYRQQQYSGPVKRYCQTLDLRDNPELIAEAYDGRIDLMVEGEQGEIRQSKIVDCTGDNPVVIREL